MSTPSHAVAVRYRRHLMQHRRGNGADTVHRLRRSIVLAVLLQLGGCSTFDGSTLRHEHSDVSPGRISNEAVAASDRPRGDIDGALRDAADAYRDGRLAQAGELYRTVLAQRPREPRALFNLSMVRLQQAYAGLQQFIALDTVNPEQGRAAASLLGELARYAGQP